MPSPSTEVQAMPAVAALARDAFTRDRVTWLAYFMLAWFAYTQAALGPAMPFLREELALSYTVGGLQISAFAVGMVAAGLGGVALARRWEREVLFWGGGGGMAAGALLLIAGRSAWATVPAALTMGLSGTLLMTMVIAILADRHGAHRATALTEANVVASGATTLPPLLIGLFAGSGLGWRWAFVLTAIAWLIAFTVSRRMPLPHSPAAALPDGHAGSRPSLSGERLPRAFWAYWTVIVLVVAAEWSMITWSADFLVDVVGLETALAAGLTSAFFLAMVTGRWVGSRLTTRRDAVRLLPGALALAIAGFGLFWLAGTPILNVAGLFLAGLGIANLYPFCLSIVTTVAADRMDRASARVSLAAGVAILGAPLVLGRAADAPAIGLANAVGLVLVLLLAAGVVIAAARRL